MSNLDNFEWIGNRYKLMNQKVQVIFEQGLICSKNEAIGWAENM